MKLNKSLSTTQRPSKTLFAGLAVLLLCLISLSHQSYAERIKDIAMVEGARSNQLVGFGLVVGLDGTGDQVTQTPFTIQAARSMLQQFGVNLPPGVNPQTKKYGVGDCNRRVASLWKARSEA
jgi:flagellar P-ring protein precursor FlgI